MVKQLRPWMQYVQFEVLADAGEKAVLGRDGWLFYRPGVRSVTGRPTGSAGRRPDRRSLPGDPIVPRSAPGARDPAAGRARAQQGERLSRDARPAGRRHGSRRLPARRALCSISWSERHRGRRPVRGIPAGEAGTRPGRPRQFYLAQDSHWSPRGMELAAGAVARRIGEGRLGRARNGRVRSSGRSPSAPRRSDPDAASAAARARSWHPRIWPACKSSDGTPVSSTKTLTRCAYPHPGRQLPADLRAGRARARPGSSHIWRENSGSRWPSIVNDGGASTLVRQDLTRRPRLLANKTLVIWEFVERDILDGTEGWQIIPLPKSDPTGR